MVASVVDKVWAGLACVLGVLFGFCYVPPADSPYFNPMVFSAIHERVKVMDESTRVIIMSDLSARFGEMVRNLPRQTGNIDTSFYDYPNLPDPVSHPTENAISIMATRCSEE